MKGLATTEVKRKGAAILARPSENSILVARFTTLCLG